jgi:hypothetical protein
VKTKADGLFKSDKIHFRVRLTSNHCLIAEPRSPDHSTALRALHASRYGEVLPTQKPLVMLYRKSEISAFLRLLPHQSAKRVRDGFEVIAPIKDEAFLQAFGL